MRPRENVMQTIIYIGTNPDHYQSITFVAYEGQKWIELADHWNSIAPIRFASNRFGRVALRHAVDALETLETHGPSKDRNRHALTVLNSMDVRRQFHFRYTATETA